MVTKPARDQRTPRQSHSSGSYRETGMGGAERFHRDGGELFDFLKVSAIQKPARAICLKKFSIALEEFSYFLSSLLLLHRRLGRK